MSYVAMTPPLAVADAEAFGRYLAQYAIGVTGLAVRHRMQDGRYVRDEPLADTVGQAACGGVAGVAVAPVAVGLGLALPVLALPVVLAGLVADLKAMFEVRKRQAHPGAVASEVRFTFANVSSERLRWAEYQLGVYGELHGWQFSGLQHAEQQAVGGSYAARTGRGPTPWDR
jgi:hypothetical protein